jgi:DNA polymerase I
MFLSWLLDPPGNHHLKGVCDRFIDPEASYGQWLLKKTFAKNKWTWATVPVDNEIYWIYSALDPCLAAALYNVMQPLVEQEGLADTYELEMAVMQVFKQAENRGTLIDVEYTKHLHDQWSARLEELKEDFRHLSVENPNSKRQLVEALKADGWVPDEFTESGEEKLDKTILAGLDNDIADKVIEFKQLTKWSSAYLENFLNKAQDGIIHPSINSLRAKTGRMSITNPALQTLPKGDVIRNCIVPRKGYKLLSVDYSQIEYRLLAHFSGEEALIQAYIDGSDAHAAVAEALGVDRNIGKTANFGAVYGAGPDKFADTVNCTIEEAELYLKQYWEAFPKITALSETLQSLGRSRLEQEGRAYIKTPQRTLALGAKDHRYYALLNYLCQGTAAEVLKSALLRLQKANLDQYIKLPIHDEFLFELPEKEFDVLVERIKVEMEDLTSYKVPLTVSVSEPMDRWGGK